MALQRRAFLQSLLAGGAALAAPTLTRTVRAEPLVEGEAPAQVLEQIFELRNGEKWSYGTQAFGMQVAVPAGGRARVLIVPPQDVPIQVVSLAVSPLGGGEAVSAMVPDVFYAPVDIRVLWSDAGPIPLDPPASTHERPFVLDLQSHDAEDAELMLAAFFVRIPVGDGLCQRPSQNDPDDARPPIDLGFPGSFTNHWPAKDDDGDGT